MAIENGTYIKLSYTGSVNGVPFDTTDAEVAKTAEIYTWLKKYYRILIFVS